MASEKIVRILKAKSPFSAAEIDVMSDAEGWDWVYANAKPRKEKLTQVCFTGFSAVEKAELSALAATARLEVVGSITKNPKDRAYMFLIASNSNTCSKQVKFKIFNLSRR
jgi:hypothetical protein